MQLHYLISGRIVRLAPVIEILSSLTLLISLSASLSPFLSLCFSFSLSPFLSLCFSFSLSLSFTLTVSLTLSLSLSHTLSLSLFLTLSITHAHSFPHSLLFFLTLSAVCYLVLDEADRMLDDGFEPAIRQVRHQNNMF